MAACHDVYYYRLVNFVYDLLKGGKIATHPYFNPDRECFVFLLLNTRRRVKGQHLVTIGTMNTLLVHPRKVFSVAVAM